MSKREQAPLVPAVAYTRKSTKGQRNGREKQEKSLELQKRDILRLAEGRFKILKWFEDEGISGWKRGAKRKGFQEMLTEVQRLGAKVILCDALDRFSRATYKDVQKDVGFLEEHGVERIIPVYGGKEYVLNHRNDLGEIVTFATAVWAAHDYVRSHSRRMTRARLDKAAAAKRTGGKAPYGYENDGKGGLRVGDAKKVEVVRWIFRQFVDERCSINEICSELNLRKPDGDKGKTWFTKTVGAILKQEAYRGTFAYGKARTAAFHTHDQDGNVIDVRDATGPGKVLREPNAHEAIIDAKTFNAAAARLRARSHTRKHRKQKYVLSGIIVCGHCGQTMYGQEQHRASGTIIYKCGTDGGQGKGTCPRPGAGQVRQDVILPFVMKKVGEELNKLNDPAALRALLPSPPGSDEAVSVDTKRLHKRLAKLDDDIDRARRNQLLMDDEADFKWAEAEIKELKTSRALLEQEIQAAEAPAQRFRLPSGEAVDIKTDPKWLAEVQAYWAEIESKLVSIPVSADLHKRATGGLDRDPFAEDENAVLAHDRKVNEFLRDLGLEVAVWHGKQTVKRKKGGTRDLFPIKKIRIRLGQQEEWLKNLAKGGQPGSARGLATFGVPSAFPESS
jgi:DNA invertase Pin-like site-specific DNA recombinase